MRRIQNLFYFKNLKGIIGEIDTNSFIEICRLGVLAADGYCRPFDINATGYTRSEAVCIVFLQKAKDAKRVYSTVLYSKANCDGKIDFGKKEGKCTELKQI